MLSNSVYAGAELVVRPKTHSRESNRGMLKLAEEEGSRRNASSPVQSPCHSLPSGRPHRRESEPVGPQRAVRGLFSQWEENWSLENFGGQMRKCSVLQQQLCLCPSANIQLQGQSSTMTWFSPSTECQNSRYSGLEFLKFSAHN